VVYAHQHRSRRRGVPARAILVPIIAEDYDRAAALHRTCTPTPTSRSSLGTPTIGWKHLDPASTAHAIDQRIGGVGLLG
jgi:hypothetical protein